MRLEFSRAVNIPPCGRNCVITVSSLAYVRRCAHCVAQSLAIQILEHVNLTVETSSCDDIPVWQNPLREGPILSIESASSSRESKPGSSTLRSRGQRSIRGRLQ